MADARPEAAPPSLMPVVAAALVDVAGRVLVQRRPPGKPHPGLWEFPGGKIEAGETPEGALARELAEELGITVDPGAMEPFGFASEPSGEGHLLLVLYRIRRWTGEPRAETADTLGWHSPNRIDALAMSPADRPLLAALTWR